MFDYDKTDSDSILAYAKKLIGCTFLDVLKRYYESMGLPYDEWQIEDTSAKGQLGDFLEKYYFGYEPNNKQEADFKEAGVELKQTCIDVKKDGRCTAGERLSITNISYEDPVEPDFKKSHVWEKIRLMLLVHYIRDKSRPRMMCEIRFVNLFTPPKEDLEIIVDDYHKIISKIKEGRAHELSESDTVYLGASTKGATAAKSLRPQLYGDHVPAKKRNFCFKRQYMDYVLHQYVLKDAVPYERVINGSLGEKTFEEAVLCKITPYIGKSDRQLCALLDREYNNNKAQWVDLTYRMLGIKGNHAEEFVRANIVVKAIRLEENGRMRESMSFPPFKFLDLAKQDWEDSDVYEYFSETRFLFVVFKKKGNEYLLYAAQFWNMPVTDLEGEVRKGWEAVKDAIVQGVQFSVGANGTVSNNLPGKRDNQILHVRPHSLKAAYKLSNGYIRGNVERDANQLPDGQWMTTQSFWINNSYLLEQLESIKKNSYIEDNSVMTAEEVLKELSCFHREHGESREGRNMYPINRLARELGAGSSVHISRVRPDRKATMYKTSEGERVIYCRGEEHQKTSVYFRMVSTGIITSDGDMITDIGITDIWELFYALSEKDMDIVACVALVFYHLKICDRHIRMTRSPEDNNWKSDRYTANYKDIWIMPCFSDDVLRSLNELVGEIPLRSGSVISFEAFIYYWEMVFISAAYSKNKVRMEEDISRRRICNLVLHISAYYMGHISYVDLLERTVGSAIERECGYDEIEAVTKGAVHDVRTDLIKALKEQNIVYHENKKFQLKNGRMKIIPIFIPISKIMIFHVQPSREVLDLFENEECEIIVLSKIKDFEEFDDMLQHISSKL